jgi:hypothetical protein
MVRIIRSKGSLSEGMISHSSPIGQTLLGAFLNKQVTIYLPTGAREFKVINRANFKTMRTGFKNGRTWNFLQQLPENGAKTY